MTERQKKFDEEHPYKGMTVKEIDEWIHLQRFGFLPGRVPYDAQGTAPRAWGEAEKTQREKSK